MITNEQLSAAIEGAVESLIEAYGEPPIPKKVTQKVIKHVFARVFEQMLGSMDALTLRITKLEIADWINASAFELKDIRMAPALDDEDLARACRNIGYDLRCGACASVFFTGKVPTLVHDPLCSTVHCAWMRDQKRGSSAEYVFRCDACDAAFEHPNDDDCPTTRGFCSHLMRAGWMNTSVEVTDISRKKWKKLLARGGWLCPTCVDRYVGGKRVRAGRVSSKERVER